MAKPYKAGDKFEQPTGFVPVDELPVLSAKDAKMYRDAGFEPAGPIEGETEEDDVVPDA